ncbi:hypothetical protein DSM3645_17921 [Blastopirellula marina DSM 3645]|uniref:Uncharacterized protein n=1 Tax=Blastopirellula marina DSM 3645 TaxID=314230 RepID=A4A320_9BACT|nr:hypothetical protein DSM3645_17921 [Blastopirellula marina DSM 3645]
MKTVTPRKELATKRGRECVGGGLGE